MSEPVIILSGGHVTHDKRLDRIPFHDSRSRMFPIMAALTPVQAKKPRSYRWRCDAWLDQGNEGACVGFAVAHEAVSKPVVVKEVTAAIAHAVYKKAQLLDDWPDDTPYEGTSVLAGMKAGVDRGWFLGYNWAFGLEELVLAVGYKGPAVLGLNWYETMRDPQNGFIAPGGSLAGGHAILCNAVDIKARTFTLHNSWGQSWGINGECRITFDSMDRLLHEYGEAAIPIRNTKKKTA